MKGRNNKAMGAAYHIKYYFEFHWAMPYVYYALSGLKKESTNSHLQTLYAKV